MTYRVLVKPLAISVAMAVALAAGAARAQDEWKEDGGEKAPPDDHKKKDAPEPTDPNAESRRFMIDLKLGPAFVLGVNNVTDFGLQVSFGYAIAQDLAMKGDALYLQLAPYFIVGEDFGFVAPLGAQYELPLSMIPYKGVSAYARVSVGYAYYQPRGQAIDQGFHGFGVQPALGAKITFFERFHAGIEPFGFDILQIFAPRSTTQSDQTITAFQLSILGGVKF